MRIQYKIYADIYSHDTIHEVFDNKCEINCIKVLNYTNSFDVEIKFPFKIVAFRNHDYTWLNLKKDRLANEFTSKIIKLEDGTYVQANINQGIWEINKKNPSVLLWKFNPNYSKPIAEYVGESSQKRISKANTILYLKDLPTLLFSKIGALEISRSAKPFSAIACFTDHCDFDTLQNLKLQRQLFKETNIKVTKGFFVNHFSKRNDNASYENDNEELDLWAADGHEMCYHSLSQSIKSDNDSFTDFENFKTPYNSTVWIDHGFQPYNFSLYVKNKIDEIEYATFLRRKNITTLWNYVDSGTATIGVINQLNTAQFTLNNFVSGIQNFSFKTKLVQLFKNIIFHYDNDEKRVRNYIDTLTYTKNVLQKRKISSIFPLFKNAFPLLIPVVKVVFLWNFEKNKGYKVAKYAPLVFNHFICKTKFHIFQTIEMVDFKKALCKENVDSLIKESGIFIAHTYFSVDMKHYSGKLFKSEGELDEEVVENFKYLSSKIADDKIWNPTLSELVAHFKMMDEAMIEIDVNGNLSLKNNSDLTFRIIQ